MVFNVVHEKIGNVNNSYKNTERLTTQPRTQDARSRKSPLLKNPVKQLTAGTSKLLLSSWLAKIDAISSSRRHARGFLWKSLLGCAKWKKLPERRDAERQRTSGKQKRDNKKERVRESARQKQTDKNKEMRREREGKESDSRCLRAIKTGVPKLKFFPSGIKQNGFNFQIFIS